MWVVRYYIEKDLKSQTEVLRVDAVRSGGALLQLADPEEFGD